MSSDLTGFLSCFSGSPLFTRHSLIAPEKALNLNGVPLQRYPPRFPIVFSVPCFLVYRSLLRVEEVLFDNLQDFV